MRVAVPRPRTAAVSPQGTATPEASQADAHRAADPACPGQRGLERRRVRPARPRLDRGGRRRPPALRLRAHARRGPHPRHSTGSADPHHRRRDVDEDALGPAALLVGRHQAHHHGGRGHPRRCPHPDPHRRHRARYRRWGSGLPRTDHRDHHLRLRHEPPVHHPRCCRPRNPGAALLEGAAIASSPPWHHRARPSRGSSSRPPTRPTAPAPCVDARGRALRPRGAPLSDGRAPGRCRRPTGRGSPGRRRSAR